MTKDQIVRLTTVQGLRIGDTLGDMCVLRGETPIDYYKYLIIDINTIEDRIRIEGLGWYDVGLFFKLGEIPPKTKCGHALTKMFQLENHEVKI